MIDILQYFLDLFSLLLSNMLCMFIFIIGVICLVLLFVFLYIRKIMGRQIWLHKGK